MSSRCKQLHTTLNKLKQLQLDAQQNKTNKKQNYQQWRNLSKKMESLLDRFIPEHKIIAVAQQYKNNKKVGHCIYKLIAGCDSPQAWDIRKKLIDEGVMRTSETLLSLVGIDSQQAWDMRYKLEQENIFCIMLSLAGLDSPQAWNMRYKCLKNGTHRNAIARSLDGLNSPQAWNMRNILIKDAEESNDRNVNSLYEYIAEGLILLDNQQAWNMRRYIINKLKEKTEKTNSTIPIGNQIGHIVSGLAGIDSDEAWELREMHKSTETNSYYLNQSLILLDSPRAWKLREEISKIDGISPSPSVANTLAGLDSTNVQKVRAQYQQKTSVEYLLSINTPRTAIMRHIKKSNIKK